MTKTGSMFMKTDIRWQASCALLCLMLLGSGCVSVTNPDPAFRPPSVQLRASLGTIGVECSAAPQLELQKPKGKGSSALSGAGKGFGVALEMGGGSELGALVSLVAMPFTTIGGAIGGSIKGVSAKERSAAEAILTNALVELAVPELLRDELVHSARLNATNIVLARAPTNPPPALPPATERAPPCADPDTILDLQIQTVSLIGKKAVNPPLGLLIVAQPRLQRADDHTELYAYSTAYYNGVVLSASDGARLRQLMADARPLTEKRSDVWTPVKPKSGPRPQRVVLAGPPCERKFAKWSEKNVSPLREEVRRAARVLATAIAEHLFAAAPSPETRSSAKETAQRSK